MKGREKRAKTIKCFFLGTFAQLYGTWKVFQQLKAIASRFWLIINRSPLLIDQKCIHNKNFCPKNTFAPASWTRLAKVSCGGWLNCCEAWIFHCVALRKYDGWRNKFKFLKNSLFKVLCLILFFFSSRSSPSRKMERMNNEFSNIKTIYFYKIRLHKSLARSPLPNINKMHWEINILTFLIGNLNRKWVEQVSRGFPGNVQHFQNKL